MTLNGSKSSIQEKFQYLQNSRWIDENTRALFIEFSIYNAQINYFAVIQLIVEIPPTGKQLLAENINTVIDKTAAAVSETVISGAFFPTASIQAVRLIKYIDSEGTIVMAFEILYVIFCLVFLFKEVYQILTRGIL